MHAATPDDRFESAKSLLTFGFANYALTTVYPDQALPPVEVLLGEADTVQPVLAETPCVLLEKSQAGSLNKAIQLCENVEAPVEAGQTLGTMTVTAGDQVVAVVPIVAASAVERLSIGGIFQRLLRGLFLAG